MSHIAICHKCRRPFWMPDDILYTEATCAVCESRNPGSAFFATGSGECDTPEEVVAVVERNAGAIDNGELASRYAEWLNDENVGDG